MTIYKKSWAAGIAPMIEGLGQSIPRIMNKNYDTQQYLRQAMAKDPTLKQKLIDMGEDNVEQIYGKEMRKYAVGTKSVEKQLEDAMNSPQFQMALKDPKVMERLLSKKYGLATQNEISQDESDTTIKKVEAGGAPQIMAGRVANANEVVADSKRTSEARFIVDDIQRQYPNMPLLDLYKSKKLTPKQLSALQAVPETAKQLGFDVDLYNKDLDNKFEQQRLGIAHAQLGLAREDNATARYNAQTSRMNANANASGKGDTAEILFRSQVQVAEHIMSKTGRGELQVPLLQLASTPGLEAQLLKEAKPTDPTRLLLWEAAQAKKNHVEGLADETKVKRVKSFVAGTREQFRVANNPKSTDTQIKNAVNQINALSAQIFPEFGDDRPTVEFQEEGGRDGLWGALVSGVTRTPNEKKREKGVIIHGNADLANKIVTEEPTAKVGASKGQSVKLSQGLEQWKAAGPDRIRAELARLEKKDPEKAKQTRKLLQDGGVKY